MRPSNFGKHWTVLALLLAACSSGSDDTPTPSEGQGSPAVTPTPTAIETPTETQEPTPTEEPDRTLPEFTLPPIPTLPPTPEPTPEPTPIPQDPPETYTLSGDVEVIYDNMAIPHIYGANLHDVLFAQGYAGAKHRLWQMDVFRRYAQGRAAEVLGPDAFEFDLFTRTLALKHWADAVAERIASNGPNGEPEIHDLLVAYTAGVNAYIDDAKASRNGAEFSPQFGAIGYTPEYWYPADVLALDKLQTYSLSSDHTTEILIWLAEQIVSEDTFNDLMQPRPMEATAIVPNFYDDFAGLREKAPLTEAEKAKAIAAKKAMKAQVGDLPREDVIKAMKKLATLKLPWEGSNSWIIDGKHTASGAPILASDTHEGAEAPATYWQVHLKAEDGAIDAIGYSFAGIPFIAFGHNGHSAWAPTTNFADATDCFLEQYNPISGTVVHRGEPVPVSERSERFRIRAADGTYGQYETVWRDILDVGHHGPIFPTEFVGGLPISISAQWTGYQNRHSISFLHDVNTMQSFEDLQAAQEGFMAGAVNMVYADIEGVIGYTARADIPIRNRTNGINPPWMVVPGTGDYDWSGEILPDSAIPHVKSPETGYVVTANNDPSGQTFDNVPTNDAVYLGGVYDSGVRAQRITHLIETAIADGGNITLDDNAKWQTDHYSRVAERLLPYLLLAAENEGGLSPAAADAITVLQNWDMETDVDSQGALIFHAWLPNAFHSMFADEVGDELFNDLSLTFIHIFIRPMAYFLDQTADIIDNYDEPGNPFPSFTGTNYFDDVSTPDVYETRDMILVAALEATVDQLADKYGSTDNWTWGNGHQITFSDEVGSLLPDASVGPFPMNGGLFTVDVADFSLTSGGELIAPFDTNNTPSNRLLLEMSPNGINAMDVYPGGQSEDPNSPHFMEQVDLYINDGYRALPFYRAEVESAAATTLNFPAGFPVDKDTL